MRGGGGVNKFAVPRMAGQVPTRAKVSYRGIITSFNPLAHIATWNVGCTIMFFKQNFRRSWDYWSSDRDVLVHCKPLDAKQPASQQLYLCFKFARKWSAFPWGKMETTVGEILPSVILSLSCTKQFINLVHAEALNRLWTGKKRLSAKFFMHN